MNPYEKFKQDGISEIKAQGSDPDFLRLTHEWIVRSSTSKYTYHFEWLGRPIIQFPQDILAMQEIIWEVKPDLIIETGIAHGGSLIFSASMLELNAACGGPADAMVLGIDIDIRAHNRTAIEAHPLAKRIKMLQGSSVAPEVVQQVHDLARNRQRVLVSLDSNHTHEHVIRELESYAPLTSLNSYCVVFDTIIEQFPEENWPGRSWGPGNSPDSAVREFLKKHPEFEVDTTKDNQILISVAPRGYLKRVR